MLRLPRRPLFQHTALASTLLLSVGCLPTLQGMLQSAEAEGNMGEIVKAFCLSAFESEMIQSGKTPPAGMANFACGCVANRIGNGSSIASARSDCRQATARRYPI
jgi:phosphoribosylformylglycinamidine (FGAM) synthase-like enzyme